MMRNIWTDKFKIIQADSQPQNLAISRVFGKAEWDGGPIARKWPPNNKT